MAPKSVAAAVLLSLGLLGCSSNGSSSAPSASNAVSKAVSNETAADVSGIASNDSTPVTSPGSVAVKFDATRSDPRPIKETVVPIPAPTDVLSMRISGFSYRGVICGFSLQGETPPSPVTIRQFVTTPVGTYDSGPLAVSWTSLDDHDVTGGSGQIREWNFDAEAHKNRSGPGWVVSIGGVTAPTGNEKDSIPTDGGCELRSASKVFTPSTGPVAYWAGFATV